MPLDKEIYMSDYDYEAMLGAKFKKYWADIDERDQFVSGMNEAHKWSKDEIH
jgi:hypothetical protein